MLLLLIYLIFKLSKKTLSNQLFAAQSSVMYSEKINEHRGKKITKLSINLVIFFIS